VPSNPAKQLKYEASHPISYTGEGFHPEFPLLWEKFITGSLFCNGGDVPRVWSYILNVKQILYENIPGDFAELGVWRGNSAAILAHLSCNTGRQVYLFDTFEGFDKRDIIDVDANKPVELFSDKSSQFGGTSIEQVRKLVGEEFSHCHYVKGYFPASVLEIHKNRKYSVASLDCDLYAPMKAGLEFFYPRMSRGGVLIIHDYASTYWQCKKAVDEFCADTGEYAIVMPDVCGSVLIRKTK